MRMLTSHLVTLGCALPVLGTFLPVSTHNEMPSLRTRGEQKMECFQPVPTIDLHYMEEYLEEIPYVVKMTASHKQSLYVAVESFEHLLADFTCSPLGHDDLNTLVFAFDTVDSLHVAREIWADHQELLFVTHHVSCNSFDERAVYKASAIIYDFENLIAIVTGRHVVLGKSPEASSTLRVEGGPLNTELRKRLRRRRSLEAHSDVEKRDLQTSQWIMDLNAFGKFDPREDILTFELLKLACVDCSLSGKVAAYFDLDINLEDVLNPLDGDINPFNVARLRLQTLEAIDGDFNIEIEATAAVIVSCSFPGGCSKGKYTQQGKRFMPSERREGSGIKIGGLKLDASFSLGLAVGLDVRANINVTIPITLDAPANKGLYKNFFGDGSGKDELTPLLKPKIGQAIFNREDAQAQICGFVALGPAITFEANIKDVGGISLTARLDLPRLKLCASLAQDVDRGCDPGPFDEAIKLSLGIGAGLAVTGQAFIKLLGGPEVSIPAWNLETKGLYWNWPIADVCFDISGDDNDNTLPTIPDSPDESVQPNDPDFGVGNPKNETGPGAPGANNGTYDCSSVAPSPGGQPCGSVVMLCPDAYHWSCGNGQEGIVPPGTFCACGAFRYPGWLPPTAVQPACTQGIVCVGESKFSVCSPAGIEPPQDVTPGTVCRNGELVAI